MSLISKNLEEIFLKMESAYSRVTASNQICPKLLAVSKTHPYSCVIDAYNAGQRLFGENYIQELVEKSNNEKLRSQCPDIKWHFIGKVQSNKLNMLLGVPNLAMIETVTSVKVASILNDKWKFVSPQPLDILLQVNTSDEPQKGGIPLSDVVQIYKSISESCKHLRLCGLMTIGKYGYDPSKGPNPDFLTLRACRTAICSELSVSENTLHLSMGMSTDFEMAIELGSTLVRMGTAIFGVRQ